MDNNQIGSDRPPPLQLPTAANTKDEAESIFDSVVKVGKKLVGQIENKMQAKTDAMYAKMQSRIESAEFKELQDKVGSDSTILTSMEKIAYSHSPANPVPAPPKEVEGTAYIALSGSLDGVGEVGGAGPGGELDSLANGLYAEKNGGDGPPPPQSVVKSFFTGLVAASLFEILSAVAKMQSKIELEGFEREMVMQGLSLDAAKAKVANILESGWVEAMKDIIQGVVGAVGGMINLIGAKVAWGMQKAATIINTAFSSFVNIIESAVSKGIEAWAALKKAGIDAANTLIDAFTEIVRKSGESFKELVRNAKEFADGLIARALEKVAEISALIRSYTGH